MSEKIKLNVTMTCKADSYKQANNLCVVEEIVPIPDVDFLEMATYPCRDNPHITLHKDSMYADSEAMHCVLFIAEKQGDGFLVECEGYDYARYSQYIPHAADIVAGQQRRLSEASEKLYAALDRNLTFLVNESRAEPYYKIPIDAVFNTPEIQEGLLDVAREIIAEHAEFADIQLTENDHIVTIDGDKYDTLRFISPLRVDTDCLIIKTAVEPEDALKYATFINNELDADIMLSVHYGLMEHCSDKALVDKIYSVFPSVEKINGELVGVTEVKLTKPLDEQDMDKLKAFITGQYSQEWGKRFYDNGLYYGDDRIYVGFGNADDFQLIPEEDWDQSQGEGLALQQ